MDPPEERPQVEHVQSERSREGYLSYSPPYMAATLAEQPSVEALVDSTNHHATNSPYAPPPASVRVNPGPVFEVASAENNVEHVAYSPNYTPPAQDEGMEGERYITNDSQHAPYSPSDIRVASSAQVYDGNSSARNSSSAGFSASNVLNENDVLPSAPVGGSERNLQPEARLRRLIESHHRFGSRRPVSRFRSTIPYVANPGNTSAWRLNNMLPELMIAEGAAGASVRAIKTIPVEQITGKMEGAQTPGNSAAGFDCNICFDMANEPVVTSCGHLFCWPCLFQWLDLHSDYKECPVCKGEVTESNITPIYGRGSSESDVKKRTYQVGPSNMKIPPRPGGCRFQSLRQGVQRPPSRTWSNDEEYMSWRNLVEEEIRNRGADGLDGRRMTDSAARRARMSQRAIHWLQRMGSSADGLNTGSGPSGNPHGNVLQFPNMNINSGWPSRAPFSASMLQDRIDVPGTAYLYGPPAWISGVPGVLTSGFPIILTPAVPTVVERMRTGAGSSSSGSASVNPRGTEPLSRQLPQGAPSAIDQASGPTTMAVAQSNNGVSNASVDPNAPGTSRSARRRRTNGAMGSLDVDGGLHPARKRRQLN